MLPLSMRQPWPTLRRSPPGSRRAGDFVDKIVDLLLAPTRDGHLVCQDNLGNGQIILLGVLPQFLHRGEGILRSVLLRGRVVLPLDEPAAHRVILLFEDYVV